MKTELETISKQFLNFFGFKGELFPGLSISLCNEGRNVIFENIGFGNLDGGTLISSISRFHIASLTKQIIAALTLHLDQVSAINLDDLVSKYISIEIFEKEDIRIKHLIQHSSGLRDQWVLLNLAGWKNGEVVSIHDINKLMSYQDQLNHMPGSQFNYSNTGYTYLAEIIEKVTNTDINDFANEILFHKLGMTNTRFRKNHKDYRFEDTLGYVQQSNSPNGFELSIPPYDIVGATSLITSSADFLKWCNYLVSGSSEDMLRQEILSKSKLDKAFKYGYGLYHIDYAGESILLHSGWDYGFSSYQLLFPNRKGSVIILSNTGIPRLDMLAFKASIIALSNSSSWNNKINDFWDSFFFGQKHLISDLPKPGVFVSRTAEEVVNLDMKEGSLYWDVASGFKLIELKKYVFAISGTMDTLTFIDGDTIELKTLFEVKKYHRVERASYSDSELIKYEGCFEASEIPSKFKIEFKKGQLQLYLNEKFSNLKPLDVDRFTFDGMVLTFHNVGGTNVFFMVDHPRARNLIFKKTH